MYHASSPVLRTFQREISGTIFPLTKKYVHTYLPCILEAMAKGHDMHTQPHLGPAATGTARWRLGLVILVAALWFRVALERPPAPPPASAPPEVFSVIGHGGISERIAGDRPTRAPSAARTAT